MKSKSLPVIIFIALLAAISAFADTDQSKLIGYQHDGVRRGEKLPNGATDLGGGLLSDEDYSVSRFQKGKKYMLWLERIIEINEAGVPRWEVRDVLSFDHLRKNQEFLFSYSSPCKQNKQENLDLIVLAERTPPTKTYKILKAWRANTKEEKFESVSVKGIVCR
jgi:hypothetical protein